MLLATKLRNDIKKLHPTGYEFHLKNTSINGAKRGCSGFIQNTDNARIVYVDTEKSCYAPMKNGNLFRTAASLHDDRGGQNRYATDMNIANAIVKLLESDTVTTYEHFDI